MFRLFALVVCLVAGCTLGDPPPPPTVPPGPDDLSTWGTPELVSELSRRPKMERQPPWDHKPTPAEKVYAYTPGGTYAVPVGVGAPLDIVFAPGEAVHNAIDGDRRPILEGQGAGAGPHSSTRWGFEVGKSGTGDTKRGHIFVLVFEPGLKNGLTITTTRGVYAITLESVKSSPIRYLRWTHAPEPAEVVESEPLALGPLPDLTRPARWRVGYQVKATSGRTPDWLPRQALDDGKKIYVLLPHATLYGTSPLVRKIGTQGPLVVNGRQYLNILIVDDLAAHLELRVGTGDNAEVVQVTRGALRIIDCPGDPDCPRWPEAASRLQGSQS